MNRKIKSSKDVTSEIKAIFVDYKTEKILVSRIKKYIKNISGKELIGKSMIMHYIVREIALLFKRKELDLRNNEQIIKLLPYVQYIGKYFNVIEQTDKSYAKEAKLVNEEHALDNITYDIASNYREFKEYLDINDWNKKTYNLICKKNESFRKLMNFLRLNRDVACLLYDSTYDIKKNHIFNLASDKIINLSSIFIYFDYNKDIKENTENFYILLKKKIPRPTIQTAIHENIEKIKAHKFRTSQELMMIWI